MAAFNIDYSQFTPSSKQASPSAKLPKTPAVSVAPPKAPPVTPAPSAAPIQPRQAVSSASQMGPFKPSALPPTPAQITPPSKPEANPHGQFFSGNLLNKAFDIIRAPEYGFAGFLKGIKKEKTRQQIEKGQPVESSMQTLMRQGPFKGQSSFGDSLKMYGAGLKEILPAIKNRNQAGTEEGDVNVGSELGIKNKYGQTAANLGTSLISPTLPVGKLLGAVGKIPGVKQAGELIEKGGSKIADVAKEVPFVYKAIEKFNPYFRNPEVGKVVEEATTNTQSRITKMVNLLQDLNKDLTVAEQKRIGQLVEGGITTNDRYGQIAEVAKKLTDDIGREAVDMGLLNAESYAKYKGKYLSHIFTDVGKETPSRFATMISDVPKLTSKFFGKRKGAEGYVKQFAPAMFQGLGSEVKDIETAKMLRTMAEKFGQKIEGDIPEGMVRATDFIKNEKTAKYFKDMAVPSEVVDYINRTLTKKTPGFMDKALNAWKAGKTVLNPAYHVRNILSNQILSDMSTGEGLPKTIAGAAKSAYNLSGKGDQKFVKAAEEAGVIRAASFPEAMSGFKQAAGLEKKNFIQKALALPQKFQGAAEESAKVNVFKSWVTRLADEAGMTIEQALKDPDVLKQAADKAQEAIFSPFKIGPAERELASKIVPFYSFTRQALPFTVKTFLNNPSRVAKYPRVKNAVESLSADSGLNDANTPDQQKSQIRLPIKDKQGKYTYVDPNNVLPFATMFDPGGEQGKLPFGFSVNPFVAEGMKQLNKYDAYQERPVFDSNIPEENRKERLASAAYAFGPTVLNNIFGKILPAVRGVKDYAGRERSIPQSLIDTFVGIRSTKAGPNDLKSKGGKDKVYQTRSFLKEEQDIKTDQRLTDEQKRQKLFKLKQAYQAVR